MNTKQKLNNDLYVISASWIENDEHHLSIYRDDDNKIVSFETYDDAKHELDRGVKEFKEYQLPQNIEIKNVKFSIHTFKYSNVEHFDIEFK